MIAEHTPGPWSVDWESSDLFSQFSALPRVRAALAQARSQ